MRWLADENFNNDIVRGLRRRLPQVNIVRVQDVGLKGADDPTILAWAARNSRILLSHDVTTLTAYAYHRVEQKQPMSGVIEVTRGGNIGESIADLVIIDQCAAEAEFSNQIIYLPLR